MIKNSKTESSEVIMSFKELNRRAKADTMKYKLRAERTSAIALFLQNTHYQMMEFSMKSQSYYSINVELEFQTRMSLQDIIETLMLMDDCLIMISTVNPIKDYTGERNELREERFWDFRQRRFAKGK